MKKITLLLALILVLTGCGDVKENEVDKNSEINNVEVNLQNDEYTKIGPDIEEKKEDKVLEVVLHEEKVEEEKKVVLEPEKKEELKKEEVKEEIQTSSQEEHKEVVVEYEEGVEVGKKAIDFEVELLTGEKVKLSSYFGKPIFLNFWATWCGPCVSEMPDIEKMKKEYGENLVILLVNGGEEKEDVEFFINRMKYTSLVGLDKTGEILTKYDSMYIPLSIFIDKAGVIRERKVGAIPEEPMREIINGLI